MREVDVEGLESALADGAVLVDVRQPQEYAEAHVPGAVLVPMQELVSRIGELDKEQPVYLICRVGSRSAAVAEFLVAQGYDAVNVAGGTADWVRSGRAYDQGL
ncbi:MAG TPA: rhodanese-like domain-containing protein [Marmoricola sp.]|nr:rhodanese-like domain-containing protein [Marmoricola sp.]